MKWSKDWVIQGNCPVGSWITNHWTWYSNDYESDTWYGFDTMKKFGEGQSRIVEFYKIMRVSDNLTAWEEYKAAGAYGVWGNYDNTVPNFVVYTDNINVYDAVTGKLVSSYTLIEGVNKGLGNPIF